MLTIAATPMISSNTAVISVSDTGKLLCAVNEARSRHRNALVAQPDHELHVIDDAADQHQDAEQDQRDAEIARAPRRAR